ncbi:hypothetical protein Tco_0633372 [Tanacetum coccineum]
MADTRTMSELLQSPTEGYGDAIVIHAILAKNFELKVGLLTLVTSSQFHDFEKDDPHSHIRWFNKITSMLKYKNVPHEAIKLMLFPFSLEGAARIWLEKEPPPASGNLLNHTPRDALTIIENKLKVRTSRNKPVVSKVSATTSSTLAYLPEITTLTNAVKAMLLRTRLLHQLTLKPWKKLALFVVVHILTMSVLPPMATLSMLLQPRDLQSRKSRILSSERD